MENIDTLRPCPFCGGKAELYGYGIHQWRVRCECDATIAVRSSKNTAIETWNQRPTNHIIDYLLDTLKSCKKMVDEALPKFNWGASALDNNAIALLNETPSKINIAIKLMEQHEFVHNPVADK